MSAVRHCAIALAVAAVLGVSIVTGTVLARRQSARPTPIEPAPVVAPAEASGVPRIAVLDLMKISGGGNALVVDVRSADAYEFRHITGAIHVPLPEVERRANELRAFARGRLIVTYCSCPTEHTSAEAGFALMKQGVRVSVLVGGLNEWVKQGGPTAAK